jgi:hypothetical protein
MTPLFDASQPVRFLEYGRNVQLMVHTMLQEAERDNRTRQALAIIELMRRLNPEPANDTPEYYNKLWDKLHAMAGYTLDVESPFPVPAPEAAFTRPEPIKQVGQNVQGVRNKTYGRNLQLLIDKACGLQDEEDKAAAFIHIARLLKGFYSAYNREPLDDAKVAHTLLELSNGRITFDMEKVAAENLFATGRAKPVHNFQQEMAASPSASGRPPRMLDRPRNERGDRDRGDRMDRSERGDRSPNPGDRSQNRSFSRPKKNKRRF